MDMDQSLVEGSNPQPAVAIAKQVGGLGMQRVERRIVNNVLSDQLLERATLGDHESAVLRFEEAPRALEVVQREPLWLAGLPPPQTPLRAHPDGCPLDPRALS